MAILNNQSILDTRNLITGKDGQLFVIGSNGIPIFLAEVNEFTAQLNMNNTDYQPVGSALVFAVNTGHTISITLTEAVVRDDVLLKPLLDDLANGFVPNYSFQGKLRRRDNQAERQVFRNCLPDGTVDLMKLTPGEIISRAWSFRVNATPELQEYFGA